MPDNNCILLQDGVGPGSDLTRVSEPDITRVPKIDPQDLAEEALHQARLSILKAVIKFPARPKIVGQMFGDTLEGFLRYGENGLSLRDLCKARSTLFDIFFDIVRCTAWDHPWQDTLVVAMETLYDHRKKYSDPRSYDDGRVKVKLFPYRIVCARHELTRS